MKKAFEITLLLFMIVAIKTSDLIWQISLFGGKNEQHNET